MLKVTVFPAAELNKCCDFTYVRAFTRKSAECRSLFFMIAFNRLA